ncbi:MAG: TIGR00725 family protein, partial [Chloroflexi bacterium]|nr:TIGR00725 family protein [Chloroflexota bacterium]
AVIGGGQPTPQEASLAEAVGRELAKQGAVLVCGGLGGVMEAACRGAVAAGGITVGILPGDNRKTANPYVQIPIITGMGFARNVIVVKSVQAVIAVGGGYGTLSEIGHALQNNIPVVGLHTWALAKDGQPDTSVIVAQTPTDAVVVALSLITQ